MGVGRGYGKLLLFGEHAAVYGYPALGLRLPRFLEVDLRHHGEDCWELPGLDDSSSRLIAAAVKLLPSVLDREMPPQSVAISGNLPMSVGLGSSAAFCTALLRAADPEQLATGPAVKLWEAAHTLEGVFHGTPSGIDTGLSILEGASVIIPNPPGIPSAKAAQLPPGWLVLGAMPRTGSTAELVAGIRDLRTAERDRIDRLMKDLGSISEDAGNLSGRGAIDRFGELANQAHKLLGRLSLSTPEVDAAIELLRKSGAVGAKMSGAGGGGAFFGIFREEPPARLAAGLLETWLSENNPLPVGAFSITIPLP